MRPLADLFYPQTCVVCRRATRGGLCHACNESLPRRGPHHCALCGGPTESDLKRCRDCRGRLLRFDQARQAVAYAGVVRTMVHRYKYQGEFALADVLAHLVAEAVDQTWTGSLSVTWVPASRARARQRGFDPAMMLAEAVASSLEVPCAQLLEKRRETPPQMGLETRLRRTNLEGAFVARTIAPTRCLVVDDVYTTGATASEAARALKAAGAQQVFVATVARTLL